jgi:hypothetical protein
MAAYLDRHLYAGVSPNPSDYVEPLNPRVETFGNFISTYIHFTPTQVKLSGNNWKQTLSAELPRPAPRQRDKDDLFTAD